MEAGIPIIQVHRCSRCRISKFHLFTGKKEPTEKKSRRKEKEADKEDEEDDEEVEKMDSMVLDGETEEEEEIKQGSIFISLLYF